MELQGIYNGKNRIVEVTKSDTGYYSLRPAGTKTNYSVQDFQKVDGDFIVYKHWKTRRVLKLRQSDIDNWIDALSSQEKRKKQIEDLIFFKRFHNEMSHP